MNCADFRNRLDDYLDRGLDEPEEQAFRQHEQACSACHAEARFARELAAAMRGSPVPASSPGFAGRVFRAVREADGSAARRPGRFAAFVPHALAASLALGVGVGAWLGLDTPPASSTAPGTDLETDVATTAAASQPIEPVRLVFRSPRDLQGVTIELLFPDGVELEGRPGQREVSWQADLQAGANVLELPVRAAAGAGGHLVARLRHGADQKEFTVPVGAAQPGARLQRPPMQYSNGAGAEDHGHA